MALTTKIVLLNVWSQAKTTIKKFWKEKTSVVQTPMAYLVIQFLVPNIYLLLGLMRSKKIHGKILHNKTIIYKPQQIILKKPLISLVCHGGMDTTYLLLLFINI